MGFRKDFIWGSATAFAKTAWSAADSTRHGEAENCICPQSAWTCAERMKSSGLNGEPGKNVVHSPPPTMSGHMNGCPRSPPAIPS